MSACVEWSQDAVIVDDDGRSFSAFQMNTRAARVTFDEGVVVVMLPPGWRPRTEVAAYSINHEIVLKARELLNEGRHVAVLESL